MEKAIAVLCIMVLSVTAVDGVVEYSGVDLPGFTNENVDGDEEEWSTITTVTVPENKIGEVVHYDHTIRIELYFENKTSGEWTYWALDVSGNELIHIRGTSMKPDGYGEDHSVMYQRRELAAQFTVYLDDSEGEEINSEGQYDVQRDEYTDLMEQKVVRIDTNANISVDELPSTNIPLSFSGFMRSYFDPHLPKLETLEDDIYGEGQTITVGDTGDWTDETSWNEVTYEWKAEKAKIMAGYETVLINVSTDFGDEDWSLPFKEMIWISNEVSVPVKQFIRTNTSWDTDTEAGYILLENTFSLRRDGFTQGASDIPWGECNSIHWLSEHPMGETENWQGNFMPQSGSGFEDSSFHWKPEDVIDYLEREHPSDELEIYLSNNPQAIVVDAEYNASVDDSDPEGKSGEFWWNLTFGYERKSDQTGSSWGLENRYQVLVYNYTDWEMDRSDPLNPKVKHNVENYLQLDMGRRGGTAPIGPDDITSQTITMASSEKILKTDPKVIENFYTTTGGFTSDTLEWGDGDETQYSLSASSGQQGFGMDLIATLTGIQTQTWAKYSWTLAHDDLMAGGDLTTASLDAESGRIISLMEIEGTSLENAFISGD
jgi:hypothetical protein